MATELPEELPRRWPMRGVVWAHLHVNDPVGLPLSEMAYQTPRFPDGIKGSMLRVESEDVQRETALFWFTANLKRFDASAPYFQFNVPGRGWGEAPFRPATVTAVTALRIGFRENLPAQVIDSLGRDLGDYWVWIEPDRASFVASDESDGDVGSLREAALSRLSELRALFNSFSDLHGKIGHNNAPLTEAEVSQAIDAIDQATDALSLQTPDRASLESARLSLGEVLRKLREWLLTRVGTFVDAALVESAKVVGKISPWLIAGLFHHWLIGDETERLLRSLLEKLH